MKKIAMPMWQSRHKIFIVAVFIILASLDNAARCIMPPLYAIIARDLSIGDASLSYITAISFLTIALTSLLWGYWGDRSSRKNLLLFGTILWSTFMLLTAKAQTYSQLFLFQIITAIGIGCIESVGFSFVTDLIPSKRRGLMMSLWGMSQGGGGGIGALLGGVFGAYNWRIPFICVSFLGFLFALLFYIFSDEPKRGQVESELSEFYASDNEYNYRIKIADLKHILKNRSNIYLFSYTFFAMLAFGSWIWMPRLLIARVEAEGYNLEVATIVGNILASLFQAGAYLAIFAGWVGDYMQQRSLRMRAIICTIGIWGSIPFMITLFLIPLNGLMLPQQPELLPIVQAIVFNLFTNIWVVTAFFLSLLGMAMAWSANPNRSALITELNLPEHRGTVAGLTSLLFGISLTLSNALIGIILAYTTEYFSSPINYGVSLAFLQLFLVPAGLFTFLAVKTTPIDIKKMRYTLLMRTVNTPPDTNNKVS